MAAVQASFRNSKGLAQVGHQLLLTFLVDVTGTMGCLAREAGASNPVIRMV